MTGETVSSGRNAGRRLIVLVPLAAFMLLALLFLVRLFAGDPSNLPSALIGRPVPAAELPPIANLVREGQPVPGIRPTDFMGKVTLINVWASWCVPCHDEAPLLLKLAADPRFQVAGINYKPSRDLLVNETVKP